MICDTVSIADKPSNAPSIADRAREVRAIYLLRRSSFIARANKDRAFHLPSPRVLREWDGLGARRGGTNEAVWQKIVRFADQHQVEPVHVVKAKFWNCHEDQPPLPQDLFLPEVIEPAREYERNWRQRLRSRMVGWGEDAKVQFMVWRRYRPNLPDEYHWRCVITEPNTSFGPLIRYCLAVSMKFLDTAESYFEDALSEYMVELDGYDAEMGEMIPHQLREAGQQRLKEIVAELGA